MRLHRWFGPLCGALAVVASTNSVSAQQPPLPGSASAFADPTGASYRMPGPGAYPNNFQPWPAVSPYEMDYGRHVNEGGLWNYDNQSHAAMGGHWNLRADYQYISVKPSDSYIGHQSAPTYKQQIRNTVVNQGQQGGGGGAGQANQIQTLLNLFEGTNNYGRGFNWYDPVTGRDLDPVTAHGFRLSLDNLSPDGTGFELYGSYASDDQVFDSRREDIHPSRGQFPEIVDPDTILLLVNSRAPQLLLNNNGIDITQIPGPVGPASNPTLYNSVSQALDANLLNLRGIPLDDGTLVALPGGAVIGGASAVYDLDFKIKNTVEQYGGGLRWTMMPLIKTSWLRVNPSAGVRFSSLEETFSFYGRHSGWTYGLTGAGGGGNNQNANPEILIHSTPNFIDDDGDGVVDNAGSPEDSLGGQGQGGNNQTGSAFSTPIDDFYPITSVLRSQVTSYLVGPELGLNYQIGGESLKVGGRSSFALLANHERMQMQGNNIFVTTRPANLIQPTPQDQLPNDFSDTKNSTHVSPLFEQSFYVEGPFLRYVPVIRRANVFRNATVNMGYTITLIGEVTRPDENILWQGNPSAGLFPSIKTDDRSTWRSEMFNFGLSWKW